MKHCARCNTDKPLEEFHNNKSSKDGKSGRCKQCNVQYQKEWAIKNPEKAKERWKKQHAKNYKTKRHLSRKYGLTENEILSLCAIPRCQICERSFDEVARHIDHCHNTGVVRGVLCTNCNTGIGNLRDDVDLLNKAIVYLTK